MSISRSTFLLLLSALMLSLGIPNEFFKLGSSIFGIFSLVPLYLAIRDTSSYRRAGVLTGAMFFLVHLMSSFWLANFKDFALFTLGGSAMFYFFLGIPIGWALRYSFRFPPSWRPFLFAAIWTLWEWVKSIGFLAYPWGTLVMTSRELIPLIQIADLCGNWGIGFLICLFSAVCAELLAAKNRRSVVPAALFTLALILLSTTYGLIRLANPPEMETSLDTILVQNNADPWENGAIRKNLLSSQKLTRKMIPKPNNPPDLVVWSESILNLPYLNNRDYYERIPREDPFVSFLGDINAPLLAGSPVIVDEYSNLYSNSVILIDSDGTQLDWYGKIQLVCFAEYMPFTEYKWVRSFFDSIVGFSSSWVPGSEYKSLSLENKEGKTIRFAAPICFEDAFSSLTARLHNTGSNLLLNLTNDSWSKTESAEYQHFVIASFRAIELRTTLVRSTNAGYSVVVDPFGRVLYDMPLFVADSIRVPVPIYPHTKTVYARFGDWFPAFLAMLIIGLFIVYPIAVRLRLVKNLGKYGIINNTVSR
ncbi:MAG TPA: apolipoprotein N-acyltransferase [Treponema sp.]|nr:apolipoprotein N-acyltransferase [Treponema sp.]